jgi:hypothetical protein
MMVNGDAPGGGSPEEPSEGNDSGSRTGGKQRATTSGIGIRGVVNVELTGACRGLPSVVDSGQGG